MNLSDAEKKAVVSAEAQLPDDFVFGLDIGTRSIVGTVGYRQSFCRCGTGRSAA